MRSIDILARMTPRTTPANKPVHSPVSPSFLLHFTKKRRNSARNELNQAKIVAMYITFL